MSALYPVAEHFASFQGEGLHAGRAAYFIRLDGCDVGCAFCDTPYTWGPGRPEATWMDAEALAALVPVGAIAVVTGGEPTLYDLGPLAEALSAQGCAVHVETAGHRPLVVVDWLTVAPKAKPLDVGTQAAADEFKVVVTAPEVIAAQLARIERRDVPIWLMPEASRLTDPAILAAIAAAVGGPVRAGWQMHKSYEVR